jgi:HAMP domain-containing protein
MDIIACKACGKQYKINSAMLAGGVSFQCKGCGSKVQASPAARKQTGQHPESPQPGAKSLGAPAAADLNDAHATISASQKIALPDRIQTKISLILVVLTTSILLMFAVYNYFSTKSKLNAELEQFAEITATRLSKYLVESFWGLDDEALADSLQSEMMSRQIYGILIRDRDGKSVYTGIRRDVDWKAVPFKQEISGAYLVKQKIIVKKTENNETDKIGSVEVYITDKFMNQESLRLVLNMLITVFCANILIVILISIVLKRIIVAPITSLTEAADRISLGELDAPIRVQSKNEIGRLAEAFERMRISLNYALSRLKKRSAAA